MKVKGRKTGSISIVEVSDHMSHSDVDSLRELSATVTRFLKNGERRLILDLSQVSLMDSAGVGEAAACCKRVLDQGGAMKVVVKPNGSPKMLLKASHLDQVLELHDALEDALASFAD